MRADGIISAAFRLSVGFAAVYQSGTGEVEPSSVVETGQELKEGDLISIRGKGRMQIVEQTGKTRKGIKLTVKKMCDMAHGENENHCCRQCQSTACGCVFI